MSLPITQIEKLAQRKSLKGPMPEAFRLSIARLEEREGAQKTSMLTLQEVGREYKDFRAKNPAPKRMDAGIVEALQTLQDNGVTVAALAKECGVSESALYQLLINYRRRQNRPPVFRTEPRPVPPIPAPQASDGVTLTIDGMQVTVAKRDLKTFLAAMKGS